MTGGGIMNYINLADMFFTKRQDFADHPAYRFKKDGQWKTITFKEAVDQAEKISAGFAYYGISKGDKIALLSSNRFEWALIDYAALALGAALVPVYPTLLKDQVHYILNDSQAKIIIVEDDEQREKINLIQKDLKEVAQYFCVEDTKNSEATQWYMLETLSEKGEMFLKENPNYIVDSIQKIKREDIATIIYTSGTTGEPKGAILSHKNFLSNLDCVSQLFDCYPEDVFLSFLPLSHILERTAGHYFSCYHASMVAYAESIEAVAANMQEIKPTLMISVPRLYEKMYSRIHEAVESGPSLKRKLFFWSVKIGRNYMQLLRDNKSISLSLKVKKVIASKMVFSKLKQRVGGRLRYFVSGGAPLSAEIGEFFNAAGLIILEGYGLTETSPGISFNRPESYRFGTVGMPLPGYEVKIAEDGEILTRGDHVMLGYLNKEEETKEVIDNEGWFYTGDIGFIDDKGYLTITDRKKNIIVTSGGKNIAPQPIENRLVTGKYIEQAVVIGDNRRFCSAVIVPDREAAVKWAQNANIESEDFEKLLKHPNFIALIQNEIDMLSEDYSSFERIQKVLLVPGPFSQESGELTPSLKVKRKVVEDKYAEQIDELYRIEN
jgi:long-chain acyl-CoA synthetase